MKKIVIYAISFVSILLLLATCLAFVIYNDWNKDALGEVDPLLDENKLVVYTSHKEEVYGPIVKEFEERTGIWIEVVTGGTNELLEQIAKEDGESSADVMFGGGVDSLQAYEKYFVPYETAESTHIDSTYQSATNKWTAFSKLPLVLIYNNKLVYSDAAPKNWGELLEERWKGKIAFADPGNSGTSYTALCTMIQLLSDGRDIESILQEFYQNLDGKVCSGSGDVLDEVISGKMLVGITLEEAALKKIAAGENLGMHYPAMGTPAIPDGTAIIKNGKHRENAQRFLEFTVSDDVQKLLVEQCYRRTVREDILKSSTFMETAYDLDWSSERQDEIMSKWNSMKQQ